MHSSSRAIMPIVLIALFNASCKGSDTQLCPGADGLRCPTGHACVQVTQDAWECRLLGFCGDGIKVEFTGEQCDDGGESATCDPDCTIPVCGDGYANVTAGEACDDGENSAACDADCSLPVCGDNHVNSAAGEECDDGGSPVCNADCTRPGCGDGYVDSAAGEVCDDRGESATCDSDCTAPECGDDHVNIAAGETCEGTSPLCQSCLFADLTAQLTTAQCYLASDTTDTLTRVDKFDPEPATNEIVIGPFGVANIEAIALDPVQGRLYSVNSGQLGVHRTDIGRFVALSQPIGSGNGADGVRAFNDIDGLSFDPLTGALYGSVRRVNSPDLLIQIDTATGAAVFDAFGSNIDYVVIPGIDSAVDIDDIAIDLDGTLYAIANGPSANDRLVIIDKATGVTTDIGPTGINEIEGLAVDGTGQLWASSGTRNELYRIDKFTGVASNPISIDDGGDYEGIACLIAPDIDGDGIGVVGEVILGTDPDIPDTDGDGVLDGTEVGVTGPLADTDLGVFIPDTDDSTTTDPLDPDTDSDGVTDGDEDSNHNGRVDSGETDPNVP